MVKKLLALITALALLAAFMPCAFAEGEYKVYYDEDFEGTQYDFSIGSKEIVNGDTVNTTKYVSIPSGQIDVKYSAGIPLNGTVVEFRLKYYGSNSYATMTYIKDSSWSKSKPISITDLAAKEGWAWFRIVFSVTGDTGSYTVQKSTDRVTWSEAKLSTAETTAIDFASIVQIRINACLLDDFIVYSNGSAPTATNYSITEEGGVYTANYTYGDDAGEAEGATTIQWESSADGSAYTAIEGATGLTYTPAANFAGYLRAVITPKSTRYPVEGIAVTTDAVYIEPVLPELAISSTSGVYSASVNLTGLDNSTALWGILAVYDENTLVEAVFEKNITVANGAASFTINGTEQISTMTSPSARFFLWEAETLVPVKTFNN